MVLFYTKDYQEYSDYISYALIDQGFKKRDKILSISTNKPEWHFMDIALLQAGIIYIPVYPNINIDEYLHF